MSKFQKRKNSKKVKINFLSVEELEKLLETFVENTRQLGITVNDFQPSSQAVLNQKINFLVTGLQDIDRAKGSVQRVIIPTEVFAYIDQGRNPTLYTKEKGLTIFFDLVFW